ncbi:MAG: iron-regulated protein [Bacteroidetes bacterium RIFOXYA12_FULL_35_11]|nr:MAG: iron-regulated protein [Bacteroidetes bacterium GWF2_35_48]OFY77161.1 MAG: iron-regulated protein [Bacteroidetes bacterium RIFOXYA12_FULL_35_11]OFY93265.1 MAG: iron-regulated protein [Bacteroidetes bacterium RIFOXYC12_FULL_35_7]HBX50105.1 iron-regulated protein [Bacteroidales bacterium]
MKSLLLIFFAVMTFSFVSDKQAYLLYDKSGNIVQYSAMVEQLKNADIVFFGEQHNDPIAHWLQLEVTKSLFELKKENLVLGAEMFESDNQLIMDEFLSGIINEKKFEDEVRLWPNYKTDYRPLVRFAKENKLKFIAANIPRRYASLVADKGFEGLNSLSNEAQKYVSPLPIDYDQNLACYKSMLNMGGMGKGSQSKMSMDNLPKAQAAKDATMAHFILKNWSKGKLFIHYNGTYHSDNFESILWYIKKQNPNIKMMTISSVTQADILKLNDENKNIGDFILCVPENMTKTH